MTNTPKTKECFECGYILDIETNVCPGCKTDLTFSITKEYESINIEEVIKELNNAYYRFEAYTYGKLKKYKYFGFNDAFTKLFAEMQKPENFTPENCELMDSYYLLMSELAYYIDQGMIENENIHSNKGFVKDLEEMLFIQDYRLHEFLNFVDESKAETRFSITDILNAEPPQPKAGKYISDSIYKNQPQPKADDSLPETLSDLITHPNSVEIVGAIKIQYRNVKGKRLKLLLLALQELDLLPKERIAKKYHTYCKQEFDWNIASYNAMNGYDFNERTDVDEFQNMTSFLKELKNAK